MFFSRWRNRVKSVDSSAESSTRRKIKRVRCRYRYLYVETLENRLAPAATITLPTSGFSGTVGTTVMAYPVNIASLSDGAHTGLAAANLTLNYPAGVFGIPIGNNAATSDVSLGTVFTGVSVNWVYSANSPSDGVLNISLVAEPLSPITSAGTPNSSLVTINFPVVLNAVNTTSKTIQVVSAQLIDGNNTAYPASSLGLPATGSITINAPQLTVGPSTLAPEDVGTAYSTTLTASGGTGPYTFAVTSGTLPPGLSLSSNILSGTPTTLVGEPFNFTVTATDSGGKVGNQSYSLIINPAGAVPPGTYSSLNGNTEFLSMSGVYVLNSLTIPSGVTLTVGPGVSVQIGANQTVTLSGMMTLASGDTVTFNSGQSSTTQLLVGNGGQLSATSTNFTTPSYPFNFTSLMDIGAGGHFQASNCGFNLSYLSFESGSTLNPGDLVGNNFCTLYVPASEVQDLSGTGSNNVSFGVINIRPGTLAGGQTLTLNTIGTSSPGLTYVFYNGFTVGTGATLTVGPGVSVQIGANQTVTLSGMMTLASGDTVTFNSGQSSTTQLLVGNGGQLGATSTNFTTPSYPFNFTSLMDIGAGGHFQASNCGFNLSYLSFEAASNDMLSTSSFSKVLEVNSGASIKVFSNNFSGITSVQASGLSGTTINLPYNYWGTTSISTIQSKIQSTGPAVNFQPFIDPSVTITPTMLPAGQVNLAYSQTLTASGNTGPFTFNLLSGSGSLPAGLTLSTGGVISGTPTAVGSYTFTVVASNAGGSNGSQLYTVSIVPIVAITTSLPNDDSGKSYNQTLSATGGSGSFTFKVTAGSLPTGLALSTTGVLSGTPTATGSYPFTVTATDSQSDTASQSFTIIISLPVTIASTALPNGDAGSNYTQTLSTSGGTAPFTFTSSGTLPSGVNLSSTGVLTGTPTATGTYTFTLTVTDAAGAMSTQNYIVHINPALAITTTALHNGDVGVSYTQTLSATGGAGAGLYTFMPAGSLPGGLTLSSSGVISGTPTTPGSYTFSVTASDGLALTPGQNFTIQIGATTTMVSSSANPAVFGQVLTFTATVSGDAGAGSPGGSVQFVINGVNYGGTVTLAGGTASILVTNPAQVLNQGANTVTASYKPDGSFLASTGTLAGGQTVLAMITDNLQMELQTAPVGVAIQIATPSQAAAFFTALDQLGPSPTPTTLSADLGNTTSTDTLIKTAANVALTLQNGTFVSANTPTFLDPTPINGPIVINTSHFIDMNHEHDATGGLPGVAIIGGGSAGLQNDDIEQTTGEPGPAIALYSGTLTLGTMSSPGNNTINVEKPGEFVHNYTQNSVSNYGNTFKLNGSVQSGLDLSFTSLTASVNPASSMPETFTVQVTPNTSAGSGTPTGVVDFTDLTTGADVGPVTLASDGTATLQANLSPGQHRIVANYLGTGAYLPSTDVMTENVTPVGTAFSPNPLTATVYGVAPDGTTKPAVNVPVTLTLPASGAGGTFSNGGTHITTTTDATGKVSLPLIANFTAGGYAVTLALTTPNDAYFLPTTTYHLVNLPSASTPTAPTQLVFVVQPVDTPTGVTLPAVVVQVEDQSGNLVASDNTDVVTINVSSGPGSFTNSTTTAAVHNGVAIFNNLTLVTPGAYELGATVAQRLTGPNSNPFNVVPLQVVPSSFEGTASGFSLLFNTAYLVNSTTPVLYGQGFGSTAPIPSVQLTQIVDASDNMVHTPMVGSVILNPAINGLTFLATNTTLEGNNGSPLLPDGIYVADISSNPTTGFQALRPGVGYLDGMGDGTPGSGDFLATFTVNAARMQDDIVWAPATADGPGQPLSAPGMNQVGGGYPLYLNDSTGTITSIVLTLDYNPALLNVSGVSGSNFTLLAAYSTPGQAVLQYSGPALPTGSQTPIGYLIASVPPGTSTNPMPYKAKDLLHFASASLNGGTVPVATGDALHLVAYVGDADGNGSYTANDAVLITRVSLLTDDGFAAYPLVDPVIVADTDGSGFIPADAPLQANEAGVGFVTANLPIPPIPSGVHFTPISNNVDPALAIPGHLPVSPDGTVTVPVNIDDPHPAGSTGLLRGHIVLSYNASVFTVTAADVHAGLLLAGGDWSIVPTIDPSTGEIVIGLSSDTPITSKQGGSLVTVDFHPTSARPSDAAAFELVASASLHGQTIDTELEDAQGTFTLTLAPTNNLDPRMEGPVTLKAAPNAALISDSGIPIGTRIEVPLPAEGPTADTAVVVEANDGSTTVTAAPEAKPSSLPIPPAVHASPAAPVPPVTSDSFRISLPFGGWQSAVNLVLQPFVHGVSIPADPIMTNPLQYALDRILAGQFNALTGAFENQDSLNWEEVAGALDWETVDSPALHIGHRPNREAAIDELHSAAGEQKAFLDRGELDLADTAAVTDEILTVE
jgi:Bacterial Ig-like domain (group 3)/Putative Ig domain